MEYVLVKKLELRGSILVSGELSENRVLFLDHLNNYIIFNSISNEVEEILPLATNKQHLHKYSKNFAISSKEMVAISFKDHHNLMLASFKDGYSEVRSCSWHTSDIEVSCFSDDGNYLVTGGSDGKLFIYDMKNLEMVLSLPHNPDYIATIAICKDNDLIVYTTFQKKVVLFSFRHNKVIARLKLADIVQVSHVFDNNTKVYFALRSGRSIIYDVIEAKVIHDDALFLDWPTAIYYMKDREYALVGSKTDLLYIVDVNYNRVLLKVQMENIGISNINIIDAKLYIGFIDGAVQIIDLDAHATMFENELKLKNVHKAKEFLDINNFLYLNSSIVIFDKLWPETLKKASNLLLKEKLEEALHLVEPFLFDQKKSDEFTPLLEKNELIIKFLHLLQNKKYEDAFIMAENSSVIKKTHLYAKLENMWEKIFNEAKELLSHDALINKSKAVSLMEPFKRADEKNEQFKVLLNNINVFVAADNAVKKKDFKRYFSLCQEHSFLKNVSMYTRVCALGERLYQQMIDFKNDGKYEEALEVFKDAQYFANIPAHEFKILIISELEFIKAVGENNISKAYALVDKRSELKTTPSYFKLEHDFEDVLKRASKLAREDNILALIELLSKYNSITQTKAKVASIIKHAYVLEFSDAIKKGINVNWDSTIHIYVKMFGRDNEIEKIATDVSSLDILEKYKDEYNSLGYEKSAWIKTLLTLE